MLRLQFLSLENMEYIFISIILSLIYPRLIVLVGVSSTSKKNLFNVFLQGIINISYLKLYNNV